MGAQSFMPTAVIIGAGNIGRGFLGQIFAESGWDPVFVDVDRALVAALNERGRYCIELAADDGSVDFAVERVRALTPDDPAAAAALAGADLAATAVGVNFLAGTAPLLAAGLLQRARRSPGRPLDVLICENMPGAAGFLRGEVARHLPPESHGLLDGLGLVETSIGRMVPVVTPERRAADPLRVWVEPYCELPVDAAGFRGPVPDLAHLLPRSPFGYYIQRKLFIHNAGHALAAYLGYLAGHTFLWEAMADRLIATETAAAMAENARALGREHGIPVQEILDHAADLRRRFANRALGDTVARVGRDPLRKLSPGDRLVGAARLVMRHGGDPSGMAKGIAAALLFREPGDEGAARLQEMLRAEGLGRTLARVCGLQPGEVLAEMAEIYYRAYAGERRPVRMGGAC